MNSQLFKYQPKGWELFRPCAANDKMQPGRVVKILNTDTFNRCYVADAFTEQAICFVKKQSLELVN